MAREPSTEFLTGGEGNRRNFLSTTLGRLLEEVTKRTERRVVPARYFRPPGALEEVGFIAACMRCEECIRVCPANAILKVPASGGFATGTPMIDPKTQPCTVCDEMLCADVCPTEALIRPPDIWAGYRMASLELDPERCIAFQGVECGVCARVCPVGDDAISLDEEGRPILKMEGCVGCGVCVRACVTAPSSLTLTF